MNPSKRLLPALLTFVLICAGASTVSATTITGNTTGVQSSSTAGSGTSEFHGTGIPTSQLLDVTFGGYYSRTQIDYTGSGDQVTLLNTLSQKRSGTPGNYSQAYESLFFTTGSNTTYSLSGAYSVSGVATEGSVYFNSYLYDNTTSTLLARSYQYSQSTLNESFVMGGMSGDTANLFVGSLTGSLIAGHEYEWLYTTFNQSHWNTDGGATATGFFRLDIGGGTPSSVPDGGPSLALFGLAVIVLAACRGKVSRT